MTAFLLKDHWEGSVTVCYDVPDDDSHGFGDPMDVAWKECGRSAWEALANTITRFEREGRQSSPDEPMEMQFWDDADPPVKLLWPRFREIPKVDSLEAS